MSAPKLKGGEKGEGRSGPTREARQASALAVTFVRRSKSRKSPRFTLAIARSAGIQGEVVIEATIDEEGNNVADARVVKSVPMLDQAALEAVQQWRHQPSLL